MERARREETKFHPRPSMGEGGLKLKLMTDG
jgi:hypothetical protein